LTRLGVVDAREGDPAPTPEGASTIMYALKCLGITIVAVVAEVLVFAGYIVHTTGSTDNLVAIGQMVALIVAAFFGG
jgi:hypothetical protein